MNVQTEIRRLAAMTVSQLNAEFEAVWGEPARSNNRTYLIKRIAWRRQAAEQGGLSPQAKAKALELARDQDLRIRPSRALHRRFAQAMATDPAGSALPAPPPAPDPLAIGTVLTRTYRGRQIEVRVVARGFEHNGIVYASLTAVARAVTGSAWNGRLFFGLTSRRAPA